jgi:hypothetical protein
MRLKVKRRREKAFIHHLRVRVKRGRGEKGFWRRREGEGRTIEGRGAQAWREGTLE